MAGAIVSQALVSSFIQVVFDNVVSPEFVNFHSGKEASQEANQKVGDQSWLDDLKDAVYDVDDLLDRVSTEAGTAQKESEVVTKLEDITERLEYVGKSKDIIGLKENARESLLWRTPSTSLLERSTIYGRDQDKEAIMELLFDDTTDAKISVIPIVGMGGFGKTTLAQLVYNDESLEQIFDLKLWIYVSENFDIQKITKTMIEAVTSSSCDMKDLGFLQLELKEKLIGKKYLVVLDDVWNENYGVWNDFQKPLQHRAKGK
ncbi:hypothetical protein Ahy_A04g020980 [Arachis hypogaea]|uniref:NB-ARC domain-containing protein n=1 Tax=Arachis hypogaea TaxID=3818 RepID=A0A445DJ17_ARAHY|nr:hypothetical protein Ahy_A04g020980 [Arachis hypogaea]